jgi:hypothetical protein
MRRISRPLLLAVVCLTTSSTAQPSYNIFERASTCTDPSFSRCTEPGLPSSFCCPSNQNCIPLAANTTVLCCPSGSDCATIQPITCDISKQNGTLNPGSMLLTTALSSTLLTCGSGCCPFGYSCNTQSLCVMNANQQDSAPPAPTSSSSPSSTAASPTQSSTSTQSASVVPVTNTNGTTPLTEASCDKFPVTAVLVGFFPGLLAGILITVATICLLGAHRRKSTRRHSGSSFGNISEPQPSGADMRTDFLRKQPSTPSTGASSTPRRQNTITRVRSMFRKSMSTSGMGGGSPRPSPVPPIPLNVQRPMMQMAQDRPVTPHLQREPSYEDINIFADGDTASALRERERLGVGNRDLRASHQTTFTDMMERSGLAGLQKGQR